MRAQYQRSKDLSTRAAGLTAAGVVAYALFRIWRHYDMPLELRRRGLQRPGFIVRLFAYVDNDLAAELAIDDELIDDEQDFLLMRRIERAQGRAARIARARAPVRLRDWFLRRFHILVGR